MSKRRRGGRDVRSIRDDSRPFAASDDTGGAPLESSSAVEMTAGQMLRAMREAAGIDAALVASALKVTPQKIDALENERYDELPDLTFARGLAAAFCRAFGANPTPVLARMPAAAPGLHATGNANQPMQSTSSSGAGGEASPLLPRPLFWGVLALLLAALVIWLLPPRLETPPVTEPEPSLPAPAVLEPEHAMPPAPSPALPASEQEAAGSAASALPAASAASEAASAASAASVAPAAAQTASAPAPVASKPAAAAAGTLALEATDVVWVEVVDATGRKRVSRELAKGERVEFTDAPLPLKVAIGRREAMRVSVRGKPFDLAKVGGGSVARFQVE